MEKSIEGSGLFLEKLDDNNYYVSNLVYIIAIITKLIEFCDHHHFSNSRMLPSSLREKLYLLVATSLSPILQSPSNH